MVTCESWIWLGSSCSSASCWQEKNTPEQSFKMGFMIYRLLVSLYVCVCVSLTESFTHDFLQLTDRWMLMFSRVLLLPTWNVSLLTHTVCLHMLFYFFLDKWIFSNNSNGKTVFLIVINWEMLTLTVRCSDRHQVNVKSMERREWISSV